MGNAQSGCKHNDVEVRQVLTAAEAGDLAWLLPAVTADMSLVKLRSPMGGNTPWHKAAKGQQLGVMVALEGAIATHLAATPPHKDTAEGGPKLRRLGADEREVVKSLINVSNKKGYTPLMMAARRAHVQMVAWLLAHGADVWARDRWRLQTALHSGVEGGSTEVVRLLLNASEGLTQDDVTLLEAGNHAGLTALHYAAYLGRAEVVKVLFSYRADVCAQTDYFDVDWPLVNGGDTPLHIAAARGNEEAIRLLLRGYNELSGNLVPGSTSAPRLRDPRGIRNDYGRLAYHLAMRKGFPHLAEWLDPSVPVRFLLSGEELDTTTMYGPPRLATLAARTLHASLKADLSAIQAARAATSAGGMVVVAGSTAAAGGAGNNDSLVLFSPALPGATTDNAAVPEVVMASPSPRLSPLVAGAGCEPASGGPGAAVGGLLARAASGAGVSSRRWSWGQRRGSGSGAPSGAATPSPQHRRSSSGEATPRQQQQSGSGRSTGASPSPRGSVAGFLNRQPSGSTPQQQPHESQLPAERQPSSSSSDGGVGVEVVMALRPGMTTAGVPTATKAAPVVMLGRASSSSCEGECCGICLDAVPTATLMPCRHALCAECGLDLVKRYSVGATVCPFCRALVAAFVPAAPHLTAQQVYAALRGRNQPEAPLKLPHTTLPSTAASAVPRPTFQLTATAGS